MEPLALMKMNSVTFTFATVAIFKSRQNNEMHSETNVP